MAKITVSIPDDLKAGLNKSDVPVNLSKVVTCALDDHLRTIDDGCFWGQEFGVKASAIDLEDIGQFPLSADRLRSPSEPADAVFAKRVWLGRKPTPDAKRHAENFVKWLKTHDLRQKAGDASWMAAFCRGVQLVHLSQARGRHGGSR